MGRTMREADGGKEDLWGIDVVEFIRERGYLGGQYLVDGSGRTTENGVGAESADCQVGSHAQRILGKYQWRRIRTEHTRPTNGYSSAVTGPPDKSKSAHRRTSIHRGSSRITGTAVELPADKRYIQRLEVSCRLRWD
jgi:hypothetical protein